MKNGAAAATATSNQPSTSVVLDRVIPKKGSVRLKTGEKNPIISDVYLNRANALLGRNIPEGHVPTKVEITVRVLETAKESELPAQEASA